MREHERWTMDWLFDLMEKHFAKIFIGVGAFVLFVIVFMFVVGIHFLSKVW